MPKNKDASNGNESDFRDKQAEIKPTFHGSVTSTPRRKYRPYFVGIPGLPNTPTEDEQEKED
ncbi:MAG: hypothetical protein WCW66_03640 [Patescibacteria group bacterium]|jgi:hypothetical protein